MKNLSLIKAMCTIAATGLLLPFLAFAEDHSENRQLSAHEHGHVELNIVLEKNTLQIMMQSPGMNLVGFEHKPQNDEEKRLVSNTVKTLQQGQRIFQTTASAKCQMTQADIDTPLLPDHHDEDDHDKEQHATHKGHESMEEEHAEFLAQYSFHCEQPSDLSSIKVGLFIEFPLIEEIEGQLVTETIQKGFEISASEPVIQF